MGDPIRRLRHRAGFISDAAALSRGAERELIEVVVGFIAEAIAGDELDVVKEWSLEVHPDACAIEVGEEEYLTLSIEREGGEDVVYLERAGVAGCSPSRGASSGPSRRASRDARSSRDLV